MQESAVFYKSLFDALAGFPPESYKAAMQAVADYAFTGKEPEGLPLLENTVFLLVKPQIDKNAERYEKSLNGGRPQAGLPPREELDAMRQELGGWDAVADRLGVSKATLFRHKKGQGQSAPESEEVAKQSQKSQNPKSQSRKTVAVAKPNVPVPDNVPDTATGNENEEREGESRDAQAAPQPEASLAAGPPSPSLSSSSVAFPTERARAMPPPTREELAELRAEKGYTFDIDAFLAYYGATGWRRRDGARITDWRMEALLWQKRERPQAQARASPEYRTWRAEDLPAISDEERAAVAAGLEGIFAKLGGKILKAKAKR